MLLYMLSSLFALAPQGAAQEPAPTSEAAALLGKQDILAAVEVARSRIEDLSASFSFNMVHGRSDQDKGTHFDIVLKGEKICMKKGLCEAPAANAKWVVHETAYNGERTTSHLPSLGKASIQVIKDQSTSSQQATITEFMMLRPATGTPPGVTVPNSLVSALGSATSKLREGLEEINGHRCYVLDVVDPRSNQIVSTIWLDPEWGFLPVRNCSYSTQAPGVSFVEYTIDEAVEAAPGIWIPSRGTHKGRMPGPVPNQDSWLQINVLEMDRKPDGAFALAVNSGVEDEFFDLWKRLPPGTKLTDLDAGFVTTVGGGDLKPMSNELKEVPASADLSTTARVTETSGSVLPEVPPRLTPETPARTRYSVAWVVALVLTAALIVAATIAVLARRGRGANH